MQSVVDYLRQIRSQSVDELISFLKFKSVSADSAFLPDVTACAAFTAKLMRDAGLVDVQVFSTSGLPIVFGQSIQDPQKPTVLVYGHYDVQPPDPLSLWISPPFDPQIRDGQLYARGVSDDKGQVFCHLKAIHAWLKVKGELPVNVKVIIEGEEEVGSASLLPFIQSHRELLKADVALVSDTPMLDRGMPSICTSLRGLLYVEIQVKTVGSDLHSGQHGGAVPNAIWSLMQILTKLKDANGVVTIPGFYDDVLLLSSERREALSKLSYSESDYKASIGAKALEGETGYSTYERRWHRPTLDVNGIWGGYTGEGSKTVIPNIASAKFSMRLVANQDPEKILQSLTRYINEISPAAATVSLTCYSQAMPAQVDDQHPAIQAGLVALENAFGVPAVLQGEGGTIPVVADFKRELGLDTVLMGFNLPDDGIHAPNERFALDHFYRGMEASAWFFDQFAMSYSKGV